MNITKSESKCTTEMYNSPIESHGDSKWAPVASLLSWDLFLLIYIANDNYELLYYYH